MTAPPFRSSVPVPADAIDDPALSDFDFRVLLVAIQMVHARGRGRDCTVDPRAVAARSGGTLEATRIALGNLESAGYLPLDYLPAGGMSAPGPGPEEGGEG